MDRRTYLGSLGGVTLAGVAGCLDTGSVFGSDGDDAAEGAILGPPERSMEEASHPTYGERIPSFSLPDPLADEEISAESLEGERAYLMTFFFTSCPDGACPALLLRLRRAHEDALERGTEDETAFLAMTFDPERDTPEVLEEYADEQGVNLEEGNFHFLRPEEYEDGMELVNDEFGMPVDQIDSDEHEHIDHGDDERDDHGDDEHDGHDDNGDGDHDDHDGHETEDDGSDEGEGNESDSDHADHDHGEYTFTHYNLILLVNERGIVERAYPQATGVDIEPIVEDFRTVVDG